MGVNVREIYSICYKAYQEYQSTHDMRLFNRRIQDIAAKHKCEFCRDHLWALCKQVQKEHDEWEEQHGRCNGRSEKRDEMVC